MKAARSTLWSCLLSVTGCGLVGGYDFDYSDTPASPVAGSAGSGAGSAGTSAGAGGTTPGGKAGTANAGAGQAGAGQAGAGQAGAGAGGEPGGAAGSAGAGGDAGVGGQAGTSGGSSGQSGAGQGGAGQGGVGQAGAGQAGAGAGQGGAGQGGAGQGGAGQGGAGGCAQPTKWYHDGDFDGHGTALLSSVDACTKPADEPGVFQWVTVADDCNDGNADVFPGQAKYFGAGYAKPGAPGNLSWDYDCDGKELPTAPTYAPNCGGLALGSCSGTGYVAFTPARSGTGIDAYCGSTHTISCGPQTIFCVAGSQVTAAALACH